MSQTFPRRFAILKMRFSGVGFCVFSYLVPVRVFPSLHGSHGIPCVC
jgi:hypothetical protein